MKRGDWIPRADGGRFSALTKKVKTMGDDDKTTGGFNIEVTHLRRWRVVDSDAAEPIVFHAEQMPDGDLAINQVRGGRPVDKGHTYSIREARMLKLLLEAALREVQ